jgi:hypothetical protein
MRSTESRAARLACEAIAQATDTVLKRCPHSCRKVPMTLVSLPLRVPPRSAAQARVELGRLAEEEAQAGGLRAELESALAALAAAEAGKAALHSQVRPGRVGQGLEQGRGGGARSARPCGASSV